MKDKNLPSYTGEEDLSIFLYKLQPPLESTETTPANAYYSSNNLAALLKVCLD